MLVLYFRSFDSFTNKQGTVVPAGKTFTACIDGIPYKVDESTYNILSKRSDAILVDAPKNNYK